MPTLLEPMNIDDVETMFKVNTLGVVYSIEAVLPDMLARGKGHLAAVSSMAAYLGMPGESGYCASKAAVNSYMEGLRIQLRSRGIHVTTICPGFIETPMTAVNTFKMPWLMKADRAAQLIVRALERKKKVYNFPWQMSLLMKLTAWLPDWVIARALAGKAGVRVEI
jgi:short-subunit dehydrogenase